MLRLKFLRIMSGQTQFEISRSASISQGRYSMIERELIQPTEIQRKRLAQVLNAPASTLFCPARRVRATTTIIAGTVGYKLRQEKNGPNEEGVR